MKKISSMLLALLMLITSVCIAPASALASTYTMENLETLCETYKDKVSSGIYTNENAAYVAYENAKQYIDAVKYGSTSNSSIDSYYNSLNSAINNMNDYSFTYTPATVKSPTSKDVISSDSASGIVYYGGLGSVTGMGNNDYLASGIYMGDLVWLYDGTTSLKAPINSYMQSTTKVDIGIWKTYIKCRYIAITNTNDITLRDNWWQSFNTINDFYTRTNCTGGSEVGNKVGMQDTWIFGEENKDSYVSGTPYIASNTLSYTGELDSTTSYKSYSLTFQSENNYDKSHSYNSSSSVYVLNYTMLDSAFDYATTVLNNIDDYSRTSMSALTTAIDNATSFNLANYNFSSDTSVAVANASTAISNYSSAINNANLTYVADYSALKNAVAAGKAIATVGQSTYTDATWSIFENAYTTAVNELTSVASSGYLSRDNQARIDGYSTNLNSAITSLETVKSDVNYETNGSTATISGLTGSNSSEINIPETIGSCSTIIINNYSFTNNSTVEKVNIPASVSSVGQGSFSNCENLEDVYFASDDTEIEDGCFSNCSNDLIFHCNPGSKAWNYAIANGYAVCCLTHTYENSSTIVVPATCTTDGLKTYVCKDCGYSYSEKIVKLGHNYQYSQTVAPTCENMGYDRYVCANCNEEIMKNMVASLGGHNYTKTETVVPTCETQGYSVYKCTVCNETKRDDYTDALGHDYSQYVETVAPTCTSEGYDVYSCTKCSDTDKVNYVNALGHDYSIKVSTVASTCSSEGYDVYKCSRCGDTTRTNYKAKLAHTYVTTTKKATTSKDGSVVKKCTKCGNVLSTKTIYKASKVTLSSTTYSYTGKVKKPSVTVKTSKGIKLKNGTDYTVKYSNSKSKKMGSYTVKITFKGNYSGTKTLTYTIGPKTTESITKLSTKKKTITVKYKKNKYASGYQVQYSTSKSFTSSTTKTVTVSKKSTSKTIKKLKKGKKYYVRVRAYKTVKGKKCYASWSKIKYIKCK